MATTTAPEEVAYGEVVYGLEEPRIFPPPLQELTPETTFGFEAIEFAEFLGIHLYPWQKWLLIHGLELTLDKSDFRFKHIIVEVARQNGKTTLMIVLGLYRLFVFGASEIVSAAQKLVVAEDTLASAFRIAAWNPVLRKYLPDDPRAGDKSLNGAKIRETNGNHRIELIAAPVPERLDIFGKMPTWSVTTTDRKGGRSMSCDQAFIDELRELLTWDAWDAIEPTISARRMSQIWAFSNAGDMRSIVLRSLRSGAIKMIESGQSDETITAIFSWSAPKNAELTDVEALRQANPSMGYGGISLKNLLAEARTTENPDGFRTEKMCVWVDSLEPGKIDVMDWEKIADPESHRAQGAPVAVGVDVATDGRMAYISIASQRDDGKTHVEVVAQRAGYTWVPEWLQARVGSDWFDGRVGIQTRGAPSADLAIALDLMDDIQVVEWQGLDMSSSTQGFYDAIRFGEVQHRDQPILNFSALGAKDRKAGDVFIWDRKNSIADASALISCNIAWWLLHKPDVDEHAFVSAYAVGDWDDENDDDGYDYGDDDDLLLV